MYAIYVRALLTRSFVAGLHRSIESSLPITASACVPVLWGSASASDASTVGTKKIPRRRAKGDDGCRQHQASLVRIARTPVFAPTRLPADKEGIVFVILTSMTKTRRTRTARDP